MCPSRCLHIVSADRLTGDDDLDAVVKEQLGALPACEASAIVKDETICIRCALCAERCPTGAITMERFIFEEKPLCQVA